jgi:hypothetical protein
MQSDGEKKTAKAIKAADPSIADRQTEQRQNIVYYA